MDYYQDDADVSAEIENMFDELPTSKKDMETFADPEDYEFDHH